MWPPSSAGLRHICLGETVSLKPQSIKGTRCLYSYELDRPPVRMPIEVGLWGVVLRALGVKYCTCGITLVHGFNSVIESQDKGNLKIRQCK